MPLQVNPDTGILDLIGSNSGGGGGEIDTLTGDVGAAVTPDGSDNIDLLGDATQAFIQTTGTPASNKMEIKLIEPNGDGELIIGNATTGEPAISTLTAGSGVNITNAAGSITIGVDSASDLNVPTDGTDANSAASILSIVGAGGITTGGSSNIVTVTAGATIPTSFVTDSGTGAPSGNSLTVAGGTGLNTSSAGGSQIKVNLDNPVLVIHGGSERQSATAHGVICGGTTTTAAHQSVSGLGTSGQLLTSGVTGLPTWEDPPTGDVTAGANITDHAIVRGDGGAKGIQDSGIIIDDSDNVSGMGTLALDGDVTNYQPTNDANPQLRLGAVDAEELHIQAVYDSGAQTLDYALYQTDAASAVADKGLHRFNVDGTDIVDIDDSGVDVKSGLDYSINSTSVLNANTLGTGVLTSSLTTVGTIGTGTWEATDVAVPHGGSDRSTATAYAVICGGTSSTSAHQSVSGLGNTNQVLTSNGLAALPTWQASSGGGTSLVSCTTASGDATIDFTELTGTNYLLTWESVLGDTDAVYMRFKVRTDGEANFAAVDYTDHRLTQSNTTGNVFHGTNNAIYVQFTGTQTTAKGIGNDTGEFGCYGSCYLFGLNNAAKPVGMNYKTTWQGAEQGKLGTSTGGAVSADISNGGSTLDVDAIRIYLSSGNIASGTLCLYKMEQS